MHDFQKSAATKTRVCTILIPFQGQKSCIPLNKLQKIMHSAAFDAEALLKSCADSVNDG